MAMMAVWAAVLIIYGVFPGIAMPGGILPLDMAPYSVDDMYGGCWKHMFSRAKKFLMNERNTNSKLKYTWYEGENYYNKKWKGFKKLRKEHIVALYAYTAEAIYGDFNAAVRSQRVQYKKTFKYHALHFYLTNAIQTLKALEYAQGKKCTTGYRRTNRSFRQDVLNKRIRLGSFASSSKGWYPSPKVFGDRSCFEIITCFGAEISSFSKFGNEREVLIPPYEVFHVTAIQKRSNKLKLPCQVVYKLRSVGYHSNLNCALFKK